MFLLDEGGYYALRKKVSGQWQTILGWTASGYISRGQSSNHLRVLRKGRQIMLYINGHYAASAWDDFTSETLRVGLAAWALDTPNVDVRFDNFRALVFAEATPTPTSSPSPTRTPSLTPGLRDPSFELGSPNPYWLEMCPSRGTAIWPEGVDGAPLTPYGTMLAWLGPCLYECDLVAQEVILPAWPRQNWLSFYARHEQRRAAGTASNYIDRVRVYIWNAATNTNEIVEVLTNEYEALGYREWI